MHIRGGFTTGPQLQAVLYLKPKILYIVAYKLLDMEAAFVFFVLATFHPPPITVAHLI